MTDKFHNPYHFITVKKRTASRDLEINDRKDMQWGLHSHHRYGENTYSGRLVCKLTTEGPVVIGADQVGPDPKLVIPFELEKGKPAIPSASLRGLVSSLAEAASNSAMRVLHHKRPLSFRKQMGKKQDLSAIGMIIQENGALRLRPLALPTLERQGNAYTIPHNYQAMFRNKPLLKVYYGNYRPDGTADNLLQGRTSYNPQKTEYFYASINTNRCVKGNTLPPDNMLRHPSRRNPDGSMGQNTQFVIGQRINGNLLTEKEWRALPPTEQAKYTRGILRILGREGRNDIPRNKKHELFIPYPQMMETDPTYPIPQEVISRFHAMADERTEDSVDEKGNKRIDRNLHPYSPAGTERNNEPGSLGLKLRLKSGDLVYFSPNQDGTMVEEISLSSIWRGSAGVVEDYFKGVDPELLPFNGKRERISPAELLFGFVQDEKEGMETASMAYKGKTRISFGKLAQSCPDPYLHEENPVILKILGSPKPPSPALYFKKKNGEGYIPKNSLNPVQHEPQGRKYYLHHREEDLSQAPWRTEKLNDNINQKVRVTPIRKGLDFWFHIDFDNLSKWELGLLCYAVKPSDSYYHKIGMGKPIGLGKVKITPAGLFLVDRSQRYTAEGFSSPRYRISEADIKCKEFLPDIYSLERQAAVTEDKKEESFSWFLTEFSVGMDPDIKAAIELIGDPKGVNYPVHTPQVSINGTKKSTEEETFRWFVENDKEPGNRTRAQLAGQHLPPIKAGEPLPHLISIDMPDAGHGGGQAQTGGGNRANQGNRQRDGREQADRRDHGGKNSQQQGYSDSGFSGGIRIRRDDDRKKR